MIFCFGGYNDNKDKIHWGSLRKEGLPVHDFYDESYGYYQHLVPKILKEINEVASKDGSDRFLGVSMGGFGALLFSSLTQLGPALALSPQTTILDREYTDAGFQKYMKKIKDPTYPELSKLQKPPKGTVVAYGTQHSNDRFHAQQLNGGWCEVQGYPYKDHGWFKKVPKEILREGVFEWLETKEFRLKL